MFPILANITCKVHNVFFYSQYCQYTSFSVIVFYFPQNDRFSVLFYTDLSCVTCSRYVRAPVIRFKCLPSHRICDPVSHSMMVELSYSQLGLCESSF